MVANVVTRPNLGQGFDIDNAAKKINVAVDGTSVEFNAGDELSVAEAVLNKINGAVSSIAYVSPSAGEPAKLEVTYTDGRTVVDIDVSELLSTAVSADAGNKVEQRADGLYVEDMTASVGDGLTTNAAGDFVVDRATLFDVEVQDAFGEQLGYMSSSNTTAV